MASFERSTKANVNFRVRLSHRRPWYYGEPITGHVTMDVKDIYYMRGLILVLRGTQSCSILSQSTQSNSERFFEKEVEIVSDCLTLCGPEAVGAKDENTLVHSENTSYSIPLNAPLLNVLNGKHHFKFTLPTTSPSRANLPASFILNFPKSNDSCSISYVLELFCFTTGSCQLVARTPVPMGSVVPFLPHGAKPGRTYEEVIHYPDLGDIEIDVELDKDTYTRKGSVKLELKIANNLSVRIEGLTAAVTNHVLVEGEYLDINVGMRGGKNLKQEFSKRSGDETVIDFSDIMTIEPAQTLKRTYKMEVPLQAWPTCIVGTANSHPFWIRCYIDICFNLAPEVLKSFKGRTSLATVIGEDDFDLVGDDERGLRIPLYVVDDPDDHSYKRNQSLSLGPAEDDQKADNNSGSLNQSYSSVGSLSSSSNKFKNIIITWSEDNDQCALCSTPFSVFKWRHHCRACGSSVCADCSSMQSIPDLFGDSSQRVCAPCLQEHQ